MRVLLINPPYTRFKGLIDRYFPIGLGYVGSTLEQDGHQVAIYNAENPSEGEAHDNWEFEARQDAFEYYLSRVRNDADPIWNEVNRVIQDFKPDAVGIGCKTVTFDISKKVARMVKEHNPNIPLIWGGAHATEVPEQVIQEELVDYVVAGEGELISRDLFRRIEQGGGKFDDIDGILYKKNGDFIRTKPRGFAPDLDVIPHPARHALMNLHDYNRTLMSTFVGSIMGSRGCPYECTFCSVMNVWGRSVRWRTPDNVIDEIEKTKKEFGTIEYHFWDDTFTLNRRRAVDLCNTLIARKVNVAWSCQTRADRLDGELVDLMKEAGCFNVYLGLESGSEAQLTAMKKKITTDDGRRAAKLLNDRNMNWNAMFIVGLPEETQEQMQETWDFIKEIQPTKVSVSVFSPFPGTELYDQTMELGLIPDDIDWSTIETKSSRNAFVTKMDPVKFREFYEDLNRWVDNHNSRSNTFWKKVSIRMHFYWKHPILLAKRIYAYLYKKMKTPGM